MNLLNVSVTNLQKSLYVGAVVPDQVFPVLEDVHEMSFVDIHMIWH
jgi:hypothetical protein